MAKKDTPELKSSTAILPCSCEHSFQDSQYGKQMRVHNLQTKEVNGKFSYACTVCAKIK